MNGGTGESIIPGRRTQRSIVVEFRCIELEDNLQGQDEWTHSKKEDFYLKVLHSVPMLENT